MKLPDFSLHPALNNLRLQMGAELVETMVDDPVWTRLSIQLESEGIDVGFDEVEVQNDGTLEYKGQKVVVYIRDQHASYLEKGKEYKFHLAQCETLDRMHQRNRDGRYVVATRRDGKFQVNIIRDKAIEDTREMQMNVCKFCLSKVCVGVRYADFNLQDFFAKYSSRIKRMPRHTDKTAPVNVYPSDWREIANKTKENKNWICDDCNDSFVSRKKMLHVHHVDGDRSNNHSYNLRVLCELCHSEQPGHEHMKAPAMKISIHSAGAEPRVAEEFSPQYKFQPLQK